MTDEKDRNSTIRELLPPVSYRKPDPEVEPILEEQSMFQQPIPSIQKDLEQGQMKNNSQQQIIEQNESTISPQEQQTVQENDQIDQENTAQNQENALFDQPEILLPQECFVERCDQIITGRQLE